MKSTLPVACLLFLRLSIGADVAEGQTSDSARPLRTILFGSCIKQDLPTPIFRTMLRDEADLVLFLGDNIYADTADMSVMRAKYDVLASNPDFQQLRDSQEVMATWDDHDFGQNDAGADYPSRAEAEAEFLRFWRDPPDSPRRQREGVYESRLFGPPGRRVQVILLDTRYFRSPLRRGEKRTGGPYLPDDAVEKTMLGEPQWRWLESQLNVEAQVRLIVSSIQFIAEASGQETWSNLPRERARMLKLIRDTKAAGVVFLSGDRHWAEVSVTDVGYPLYDWTSSSFNQLHGRGTPTDNRYRAFPETFHRENYGQIRIDWIDDDAVLDLRIIDLDGKTQLEGKLRLSDLQFAD